jgi:hypothetical protein
MLEVCPLRVALDLLGDSWLAAATSDQPLSLAMISFPECLPLTVRCASTHRLASLYSEVESEFRWTERLVAGSADAQLFALECVESSTVGDVLASVTTFLGSSDFSVQVNCSIGDSNVVSNTCRNDKR